MEILLRKSILISKSRQNPFSLSLLTNHDIGPAQPDHGQITNVLFRKGNQHMLEGFSGQEELSLVHIGLAH